MTDDEIKSVVFYIDQNKAPGPDGFRAGFLRNSWQTMGEKSVK